jgi:mutator protein MutT
VAVLRLSQLMMPLTQWYVRLRGSILLMANVLRLKICHWRRRKGGFGLPEQLPVINVVAAIIEKDGLVFAARRSSGQHLAGYWEFPGGKIEPGESHRVALQRELKEELDIAAAIGAYVGETVFDYGDKVIRLHAYAVNHVSGEFHLTDHDEFCWLAPEALGTLTWAPADIPLVDMYRATWRTLAYYDANAVEYASATRQLAMQPIYNKFLPQLKSGDSILDLGCGAGRDAKHFLALGFDVTPVDGSAVLAATASAYLGRHVEVVQFQALEYEACFDAVWACASLLHVPKSQLDFVLRRALDALKPNGLAYMSFKWGENETVDDKGRYFNNYTDVSLAKVAAALPGVSVIDIWINDTPQGEQTQRWVNAVIRKQG